MTYSRCGIWLIVEGWYMAYSRGDMADSRGGIWLIVGVVYGL